MATTAKFQVARKDPSGAFYATDGRLMRKVYEGSTVVREEECPEDEVYQWTILLTPTYGQGKNEEWAKATPSGSISLSINNPAAYGQFQPGDEFTVTFEKIEQ